MLYLDDVTVPSRNGVHHFKVLDRILGLFYKAVVTLKINTFRKFILTDDKLGDTIWPVKLSAAAEPTEAINKNSFPGSKTKLRSFLGSCNVYRRFIRNFSGIQISINAMLKRMQKCSGETHRKSSLTASGS